MSYVSFDGLVDRFEGQIYQSRKGRLRMHLVDALYKKYLPESVVNQGLVLDAAGGLGQMSHWFLSNGAKVDYFDISQDMVSSVNQSLAAAIAEKRLSVQQASLTEYLPKTDYDVVNVHAVLEWLEQPMALVPNIANWVRPGGYLGLMVYNRHMLMLRHLMRGTLKRAMSGDIGGDRKGLTPISPLDPGEVRMGLEKAGLQIRCQAGVRSFSDLAENCVIEWYTEEDLFDAELALCETRPYCDMARYVLFIAHRPAV